MFSVLTREQFLTLAHTHPRVVVFKEISGDQITPVQVFQALHKHMAGASLLESSPKEKNAGRCSFLGFTVRAQFNAKGNQIEINDAHGVKQLTGDVIQELRNFYQAMRAHTTQALLGFAGGIVGFLAYDAVRLFEDALNRNKENNFPDLLFKSYRDHIAFDQKTGAVILSTVVDCEGQDQEALYDAAMARLNDFQHQLLTQHGAVESEPEISAEDFRQHHPVASSMDDAAFIKAGEKVKNHILLGDVFQVVLARTFSTPFTAKPFDIYRTLRFRNPSPYMFYLDNKDYIVAGASPEKMISVQDNMAQSCPLAGTRPRGADYDDETQAADLLANEKEVAEHMMLVDLARNDIGAVAVPGSVTVSALKQIQRFSHVMHISSTVEAPLAKGRDALDALKMSFPAGTLTGAPKVRAMQIIDEIEGVPRQLYGGAICLLDAQGNFDSCIAIRTAILKQGVASVSAGAGIVADSDLQKEADETRQKAQAVLEAIEIAQRGLV